MMILRGVCVDHSLAEKHICVDESLVIVVDSDLLFPHRWTILLLTLPQYSIIYKV